MHSYGKEVSVSQRFGAGLQRDRTEDFNLAFLNYVVEQAQPSGCLEGLTNGEIREVSSEIGFYPGAEDVIPRLQEFGRECGVDVRAFVITSGLEDSVTGSVISPYLAGVFGARVAPANGDGVVGKVTYTVDPHQKRNIIRKISLGATRHEDLRLPMAKLPPMHERPIPKRHMVYIGDGQTDAEAMQTVNQNGGFSLAVHGCEKSIVTAVALVEQGHAYHAFEADYREGSPLTNALKKHVRDAAEQQLDFFR
jgi:hypothetical protein